MKKGMLILSLLFLVLSFSLILVHAEETQPIAVTNNSAEAQNIQIATNSFLSQEIVIPQNLQTITQLIFGLNSSENVEFSVFIILIILLIGILLVIKSVVNSIETFEQGLISWTVSILITLFISATGAIRDASAWIFKIGEIFKGQDLLNLILITVVITVIILGITLLINPLSKSAVKQSKKESRRQLGEKIGSAIN